MAQSRRLRKRVERIRDQGRSGPSRPAAIVAASTVRRQQAPSLLGRVGTGLAELMPRATALRARLERAGIGLSVVDVALFCLVLGVVAAGVLRLVFGLSWALCAGGFVLASLGVPHWLTGFRIGRRRRRFIRHFPDAIDLIVRGVKSGLPVTESINTTAEEAQPLVAEVFREISGNIRLGMTLDDALWKAARRLDVQEFRFFVISLSIQQETGGNLSEILSNLSQMMRRREQLVLKIKAISAEAKASAMIIGSLPFLMFAILMFVNRPYVLRLVEDPRGWVLTGIGCASLVTGIGIMAKMVRFEI